MRKTAVLAVLAGSLCLFSCANKATLSNASSSPSASPTMALAPAPTFTVCSGTFALCTTATCYPIEGPDAKIKVSCICDVKQGYSAGAKSCSEVPPAPPQTSQKIPSRYYPITNTAVCSNGLPWAMCLDSPCTIDAKDPSKANCDCDLQASPGQGYVVVTNSYNDSTCKSDHVLSSATVSDLIQITGFLQGSQQLKSSPITIVGVGAAKE